MPISYGTVVKTSAVGSSSPAATLTGTATGDLNVLWISANSTGTGVQPQIQTPAGWTLACPVAWKTGTPAHEIACVYRFRQAGDATTQAATIACAGGGNIAVAPMSFSAGMIDTTTPIVSGEATAANAAGPTTDVTAALTLAAARYLFEAFGNRNGATWSAASDGNVHDTIQMQGAQSGSASIAVCGSGSTTSSGAARSLLSSASTSVNNTVIVAFNPASGAVSAAATLTSASGLTAAAQNAVAGACTMSSTSALTAAPLEIVQGAAALSSVSNLTATTGAMVTGGAVLTSGSGLTDTAGIVQPAAATLPSASALTAGAARTALAACTMASASLLTAVTQTPIVAAVTGPGPLWIAHRDGTYATYGEETLEGYTAAAAQYSQALLEISVWDTSDGVYVCSHDSTTGRVFTGTNRTINSTTWATFSPNGASTVGRPTTLIGGNPMRRLEEILDAFPTRLFVIENKHGTNQGTLSTLLDAHAPGRWMFKGPYNDTANANIAASHGAPMWLYFYPSQLGGLSTTWTAVSGAGVPVLFGLGDYSAAPVPVQSDANTFFTFTVARGIRTWAHILGTTAQRATADGQAATAGASFDGYMTSSFPTLAPTDSSTAAMTSASGLTAGAANRAVSAATLGSGSSLASAATGAATDACTMTSGSSLTDAAADATTGATTMASTSSLAAASSAATSAACPMASGSGLVAGAGVAAGGAVAAASASTLSIAAGRTQPAAATLSGASALTATAVGATASAATLVSVSVLTAATAGAVPVAAGMTSASGLASTAQTTVGGVTVTLASGSNLTVAAGVSTAAAVPLDSASSLAAAAGREQPAAVLAASVSDLRTDAGVTRWAALTAASASNLATAAALRTLAAAPLASVSTLAAGAVGGVPAAAPLTSVSLLASGAGVNVAAAVQLASGSDLRGNLATLVSIALTSASHLGAVQPYLRYFTVWRGASEAVVHEDVEVERPPLRIRFDTRIG